MLEEVESVYIALIDEAAEPDGVRVEGTGSLRDLRLGFLDDMELRGEVSGVKYSEGSLLIRMCE